MSGRIWAILAAIALGTGVLAYFVTLACVPHLVMDRVMANAGGVNAMHHAPRATAASHGVVRPSPDLLYSICPFDLSAGPLRVRSPVPDGTYWSVSAYDSATDNFFTLNDRQAGNSMVDFLIVAGDKAPPRIENLKTVRAPTQTGVVLIRTLISSEKRLPYLDAIRREASCGTFHASPSDISNKGG